MYVLIDYSFKIFSENRLVGIVFEKNLRTGNLREIELKFLILANF